MLPDVLRQKIGKNDRLATMLGQHSGVKPLILVLTADQSADSQLKIL